MTQPEPFLARTTHSPAGQVVGLTLDHAPERVLISQSLLDGLDPRWAWTETDQVLVIQGDNRTVRYELVGRERNGLVVGERRGD